MKKYTPQTGEQSNDKKGDRAEKIIKKEYENNGWKVTMSKNSIGPHDLACTKSGKKHYVQVKSKLKGGKKPRITKQQMDNLVADAQSANATPVVAYYWHQSGKSDLRYARTGHKVF